MPGRVSSVTTRSSAAAGASQASRQSAAAKSVFFMSDLEAFDRLHDAVRQALQAPGLVGCAGYCLTVPGRQVGDLPDIGGDLLAGSDLLVDFGGDDIDAVGGALDRIAGLGQGVRDFLGLAEAL